MLAYPAGRGVPASQLTCVLAAWVDSPEPYPLALPVYFPLRVEILVESIAQTALGMRIGTLAPQPVRKTRELRRYCL